MLQAFIFWLHERPSTRWIRLKNTTEHKLAAPQNKSLVSQSQRIMRVQHMAYRNTNKIKCWWNDSVLWLKSAVCVCYRSKAMLRVLRCVETMGDVSLWAVFSCDGCMAASREGASRGDNTRGSVYTTCFSWSTSITTAPSSKKRSTQADRDAEDVTTWTKDRLETWYFCLHHKIEKVF